LLNFCNEVLSGVDWINLMVCFLLAQKIEKLETQILRFHQSAEKP